MVGGEGLQRLTQRAADRRNALQLFRRQVVEVLVHGVARMDLVLDAIEAGHEHRRESEVGVRTRIREADLDALGLRVRRIRDAAGGRAVAGRIGQQHRRFEARDQALVGVGQRVREGVQRLRVLDDAADVVQRDLRQVGIAIACENRLAGLPDGLVHMHAAAVVAIDRLRHEGRGLAVAVGDVVDHILVDLHVVGLLHQRAELRAELMLRLRHLVVVFLAGDAHLDHGREHFGAQVHFAIDRVHREIAALHARAVAHIAFRVVLHVGARALDRVEAEVAEIAARAELHIVEHEELGLGAEERRVADAGGLQIGLGALRGGARVARVHLAGRRLDDVAEQDHLRLGGERIHAGRLGVRHQDHVGLVDRLPAGDRGAVEHDAFLEDLGLDRGDVLRGVLPLAARVGEAEVNVFDAVLLDHLHDLGDGGIAPASCRLLRHRVRSCSSACPGPVLQRRGHRSPQRAHLAVVPGLSGGAPPAIRPSARFFRAGRSQFLAATPRPRRAHQCGCAPLPGCR